VKGLQTVGKWFSTFATNWKIAGRGLLIITHFLKIAGKKLFDVDAIFLTTDRTLTPPNTFWKELHFLQKG